MNDKQPAPMRTASGLGSAIIQGSVLVILTITLIVALTNLQRLDVPGAPAAMLYVSIGALVAVIIAFLPPVYRRLPKEGKLFGVCGGVAALALFGAYNEEMDFAWSRTPQGAREQAELRQRQQQAAKAEAEAADAKSREETADKVAALDAQKPGLCKTLVDQILDASKTDDRAVLEIDNLEVESSMDAEHPLNCSGDAITSRGDYKIDFGIQRTPQGKDLMHYRLE